MLQQILVGLLCAGLGGLAEAVQEKPVDSAVPSWDLELPGSRALAAEGVGRDGKAHSQPGGDGHLPEGSTRAAQTPCDLAVPESEPARGAAQRAGGPRKADRWGPAAGRAGRAEGRAQPRGEGGAAGRGPGDLPPPRAGCHRSPGGFCSPADSGRPARPSGGGAVRGSARLSKKSRWPCPRESISLQRLCWFAASNQIASSIFRPTKPTVWFLQHGPVPGAAGAMASQAVHDACFCGVPRLPGARRVAETPFAWH